MSTSAKLLLLAAAIGADVKLLTTHQGDLTALPTTAKDSLVSAIAEIHALLGAGPGAAIDDTAVAGAKTVVWSVDKVISSLETAKQSVKDDLLNGAGAAYDTFKELQTLLENSSDAVAALTTAVSNRVRFDQAQTLTVEQQTFARDNIGAAAAADVTTLTAALGDSDADLVAAYVAAKA